MESTERYRLLQPGEMLNWYRIERVLGRGGFGVIYLATDTNLDHAVAIKEFAPGDVSPARTGSATTGTQPDPADLHRWGLERFLREARNLVKFKHPNIVRVISVFEQNDTAYLVMEFEQGQDLRTWFAYRQNTLEPALKSLIAPIAQGLAAVHRRGYIHRDIKPSNILVRDDGSPVLLDFGSARETSRVADSAFTALVSVGFAPLEQYSSDSDQQQGPWTDIYALGGVLYTAVCGCDPVDSTRRAAALFNGGRDPLITARSLGEGRYSEPFLRAIDWALAFRVADRPQALGDWLPALLADPEGRDDAPDADAVSAWLERGRSERHLSERGESSDVEGRATRARGTGDGHTGDRAVAVHRASRVVRRPAHDENTGSRRPATRRPSTLRPIAPPRRLVDPEGVPFDDDHYAAADSEGRARSAYDAQPARDRPTSFRSGARSRLRSLAGGRGQRTFRQGVFAVLGVLVLVWGMDRWEDRQERLAAREWQRQAQAEQARAESTASEPVDTVTRTRADAPATGDAARESQASGVRRDVVVSRGVSDGAAGEEAYRSANPHEDVVGDSGDRTPVAANGDREEASRQAASPANESRSAAGPLDDADSDASDATASTPTDEAPNRPASRPMTAAERRAPERLAATLRAEAKEKAAAAARRAARARAQERDAAVAEIERALAGGDIGAARAALAAAVSLDISGEQAANLQRRIDARESARGGPLSDSEVDEVVRRFDALARAIEAGDAAAMNALTENSDQNELFEQLFSRFERISIDIAAVRVRNADRSVSGTLRIENMERSAGGVATPSERYRDRVISSRRIDDEWSPIIW